MDCLFIELYTELFIKTFDVFAFVKVLWFWAELLRGTSVARTLQYSYKR